MVKSHLNFAIVLTETKAILSSLSQTGPGCQCVLCVKIILSCIAECRQSCIMVKLEIKVWICCFSTYLVHILLSWRVYPALAKVSENSHVEINTRILSIMFRNKFYLISLPTARFFGVFKWVNSVDCISSYGLRICLNLQYRSVLGWDRLDR